MDVRKKLVELIGSTEYGNGSLVGKNFQKGFIEKIASNLIDNGMTVQEWISVKDRLPEDGVSVLAICFYKEKRRMLVCYMSKTNVGNWYTKVAGQRVQVTHWMPLPHPPKGE